MQDTLSRYLGGATLSERARAHLQAVLTPVFDRISTQALTNSTLVQDTATAKTGAADSYFSVKGKLVKIAASTTMGALTGKDISASRTNVYCFFVDQAGAITIAMGTEAAALLDVVFPPFPQGQALIGYAQVTCSGGGGFTGGSSGLATAGNFTVVFVSPVGSFDPTALV